MNIQAFYHHCRCEKISTLQNLIHEESQYPALNRGIKMALTALAAGVPPDAICAQMYAFLKAQYSHLKQPFPWKAQADATNDTLRFKRFLEWFQQSQLTILKSTQCVVTETETTFPDGSKELQDIVDLICTKKEEGKEQYYAFLLHAGQARKGMSGKSVSTNISTDLQPLIAKLNLEKNYPRIIICMVYLTREADTQDAIQSDFLIGQSSNVNMFQLTYDDYYSQSGVFDQNRMMHTLNDAIKVQKRGKCNDCCYYDLCKSPSFVKNEYIEDTTTLNTGYRIPDFTEDQMQVVHHLDGPLRVCAGPGSGKTATLIGRIRYLVEEKHIDPAFLLVVTFTTEAVAELKNRCLSFLAEDHLPKIATLNSFCYGILWENSELLGKKMKLLGTVDKLKLIENIASVYPPLKGFKYGQEYGSTGLYKTIANRLDFFFTTTEEGFFHKYPELGQDFVSFAHQYRQIVELNGYITFDEQISLTNQLFATYPEVLAIYQSIYKYIMIDEFQDVNKEQVDMLYALANRHRNIVVVGDDDQSIYGFRKAYADYMIDFEKSFEGAKTVVLRKNFRSTSALVEASKSLIQNNRNRIDKEIIAGNQKRNREAAPVLVRSISADTIDTVVHSLVKDGYQYKDIAVLATKNAVLESFHNDMTSPTVLSKSFLRLDGLFLLIGSILRLYKDPCDDKALYQYLRLFGKESHLFRDGQFGLMESLLLKYGIALESLQNGDADLSACPLATELEQLYGNYFILLKNSGKPKDFVQKMALAIDWNGSNSCDVLCDAIELGQMEDMEAFYDYVNNLAAFEDDTRVEETRGNRVLLSTSHDSKGKEFKVVILVNDFGKNSEETRRLFYVAMTRAKERLFILQDDKTEVDFLGEIPYEEINFK